MSCFDKLTHRVLLIVWSNKEQIPYKTKDKFPDMAITIGKLIGETSLKNES